MYLNLFEYVTIGERRFMIELVRHRSETDPRAPLPEHMFYEVSGGKMLKVYEFIPHEATRIPQRTWIASYFLSHLDRETPSIWADQPVLAKDSCFDPKQPLHACMSQPPVLQIIDRLLVRI